MRSGSSFRRTTALALALLLIAHAAPGAQPPPPLFTATGRLPVAAVATAVPGRRARVVSVQRELLAAAFDPASAPDAPFSLNLFDDVTLVLTRLRLDTATAGHRTWVGWQDGQDEVVAALTIGPGGLSGGVVADGVAYALEPTPAGDVLIRELAPSAAPAELPARPVADRGTSPATAAAPAAGPVTVDVLVLYSPAARLRAGGTAQVQASLANAVAVTNTAFARSGVDASLVVAGLQELPYGESAGGLSGDLVAISSGDSTSRLVEGLRTIAGADLVALVTGRSDASAGCGVAFLGPSPSAIYSVTEEACLLAGQWSFSHEIGHNFGADHAPGDPIVSPVAYARGYRDSFTRTLMAYPAPGTPLRLLNFSSRSVLEPPLIGRPTGNSLQDNARRLSETATIVAAFASTAASPDAPQRLVATVSGSTVSVTWTPPATGGPVTSYALEAGPAPGTTSYGPFRATAPPLVFPHVDAGRYYLRLRSLGPGGASAPSSDLPVDVGLFCAVPGPAALHATVQGGIVTLEWSAPPGTGATRYEVGLGSAPGLFDLGVFAVGDRRGASLPAPPGRYVVRARGVNDCGPGGVSPEVLVVVP